MYAPFYALVYVVCMFHGVVDIYIDRTTVEIPNNEAAK
jgi:hypothetical protein